MTADEIADLIRDRLTAIGAEMDELQHASRVLAPGYRGPGRPPKPKLPPPEKKPEPSEPIGLPPGDRTPKAEPPIAPGGFPPVEKPEPEPKPKPPATPTPGSNLAREQGCTCPVIDNRYGSGAFSDAEGNPQFYMNENCPLHGLDLGLRGEEA